MGVLNTIVTIVHIVDAVVIIALILLQSGKASGLSGAIGGAGETFFGKNKSKTMDGILARFTKVCAILFLCTSLFLAYSFALEQKTDSNTSDTSDLPVTTVAPTEGAQATPAEGEATPAEGEATPAEAQATPTEAAEPTATPAE